MYILFYLFILIDAYMLRFRHLIAGFFYRRRQKQRIVFFYNDLLRQRKYYLARVRLTVRKLARKHHLKVNLNKALVIDHFILLFLQRISENSNVFV